MKHNLSVDLNDEVVKNAEWMKWRFNKEPYHRRPMLIIGGVDVDESRASVEQTKRRSETI